MRIVLRVFLIVVGSLVGLAIIAAIWFLALPGVSQHLDAPAFNGARYATAAPLVVASPPVPRGTAGLADPAWIAKTAKATGIPANALVAYAGAAIYVRQAVPACGIGWNTIAGIGEIESRHGTIFGGSITANGDAVPAIFGVSLDGTSTAHVPDTDGGTIDGDKTGDRAVGPMQLIPEAWRNWHADGNADGVENPQNIDDEAVSAALYLCRAGGDMRTEAGWRKAVLAYNHSDEYLNDVIRYSTGYGSEAK
jgi:membrane-bound lytic murein transglycosylase B